jgi:hypothetical protein
MLKLITIASVAMLIATPALATDCRNAKPGTWCTRGTNDAPLTVRPVQSTIFVPRHQPQCHEVNITNDLMEQCLQSGTGGSGSMPTILDCQVWPPVFVERCD